MAAARGGLGGLICLLVGGCSGGSSSAGAGSAATGDLRVASHWPADGAVQVAQDGQVLVTFDAPLVAAAVHDDHMFLSCPAEGAVEGTLTTRDNGRTVVFTPAQPFLPACDYTFTVQDEVCDQNGRLLAWPCQFTFRTFDAIPPRVTGASINGTGVDRSAPLVVAFDERIDPRSVTSQSVTLRDSFDAPVAVVATVSGTTLSVDPVPDLTGSRGYTLEILGGPGGVTDAAGNVLAATWRAPFTAAADTIPPQLRWSHPDHAATGASPAIRPSFTFNESMDVSSFELGGIELRDEFNSQVPFTLAATADQRRLRLSPVSRLATDRRYAITLRAGVQGVTDVSGNPLVGSTVISFRTGTDVTAPSIQALLPQEGATGISPNFTVQVRFSEPMDPDSATAETVELATAAGAVTTTLLWSNDLTTLSIVPAAPARTLVAHTVTVRGGVEGVRDAAGNPLAADRTSGFTTNSDAVIPSLSLSPLHGAIAVPRNARIVGLFEPTVDPATVAPDTITVVNRSTGQPVPGTVTVGRGDRALVFTPADHLPGSTLFDVTVRGGPGGPRTRAGNWLTADVTARLTTSSSLDGTGPLLTLSLNGIAPARSSGLCLPPSGFLIAVDAFDSGDRTVDFTTLDLVLTGPGTVPGSDALFAEAGFGATQATVQLPARLALAAGSYTLRASVRDLAGNQSLVQERSFTVAAASPDVVPFELTQVVWVRFDMDRDGRGRGNGTVDLDEDLLDLGLLSARDPIGRNARLRQVVVDAVLAQANRLFQRNGNGTPVPGSSVSIRLMQRQPCHSYHMRIAFGGQDPEASRRRVYGEDSSGVLGRALYDYRNGTFTDNDTTTSPALGVFPSEMFLYEGKIFRDLYPFYVTMFGRTYRQLSPHMGGTPAGEGALDAAVLGEDFVWAQASPAERLRHEQIFTAADDFATAMGTILAHEIGHSLGLTAEGPPPRGLHGDQSLHDDGADAGDVMSAYVSWDSLIAVEQRFRDIDLAFLRQRLLCR